MSNEKSNLSYEDEEEFEWDEYLKKTNSEAAPIRCFCQHIEPPTCEFKVGSKLETFDPRNTTSTCIGTVIEIQGPRLRLRLDGTDDRNDFWLMCDSDLIHPFEYSAKHGRKIQPPLGYGNDLSKWPKFLEKLIQSAGDGVFAAETCFKTPPLKPPKNEFKVGQKLEAVDPKNPHLICPATVKEINRDKLYISFDGWSHSSQFWCSYASRDLFPVGWCKRAGHFLQHPGNLEEKSIMNKTSTSFSKHSPTTPQTSSSTINTNSTKSKEPNQTSLKSTNKNSIKQPKKSLSTNSKSTFNDSNQSINNSNITNDTSPSQSKQPAYSNNKSSNINKNSQSMLDQAENLGKLDLSVVKSEAIDPSEADNPILNDSIQKSHQTKSNYVIYVNPIGDCGNFIKTGKFHTSHTKFGPGAPSNIYKSILQSFVDCANDRYEVFKLIPEGTSEDYVKLKTPTQNERKKLVSIRNISEMWKNLKHFCKLIGVDDSQLLTTKSVFNNSTNKIQSYEMKVQNNDCSNNTMTSLPLTPQPSSSSSTSSSENINTNLNENLNENTRFNNHKRSSSSNLNANMENRPSENEEHSSSKIARYDVMSPEIPITEWSIDQVVNYVSQLSENYFAAYVDIFRHHEIDGKALILLTTDILMKYMGFKLGPALKLNNYLDKLRRSVMTNTTNKIQNNNMEQVQAKTECI